MNHNSQSFISSLKGAMFVGGMYYKFKNLIVSHIHISVKTQHRLMFAKFSVLIGLQNISIDPHFYKDIPQMSIKEELTDWQLI